MIRGEDEKAFAGLVQKIVPGGKLIRTWELKGGVSAQVTALEIERADGRPQTLTVRQHGERDRQKNPQIAADEFRLLHQLHAAGLPVPKPYYVDQAAEIFPTPAIVIEYIEGTAEFAPPDLDDFLLRFVRQLVQIHRVDVATLDVDFLPQKEKEVAAKLRERPTTLGQVPAQMWEAFRARWPLPQRNPTVLLHGDFWPGNLLWRDGRLVAVIDWEDAALGDPLVDVANSRLELLWAFGAEAAERFTAHYLGLTAVDATDLPFWELYAALRPNANLSSWGLSAASEKKMRAELRWFIAQAFARL